MLSLFFFVLFFFFFFVFYIYSPEYPDIVLLEIKFWFCPILQTPFFYYLSPVHAYGYNQKKICFISFVNSQNKIFVPMDYLSLTQDMYEIKTCLYKSETIRAQLFKASLA